MAKIQYSALVNRIIGKLQDTIYSKHGTTFYIKAAAATRNYPDSFRSLQIKSNFCLCSKLWEGLPESHKELWHSRAVMANKSYFGFQMFKSLNLNLLNASHSDLLTISYPPLTPSTPEFPKIFNVFKVSPANVCLTWSSPFSTKLKITANFRLHPSFCIRHPSYGCCVATGYRMSWRFIKTEDSESGYINYIHTWPSNTRLYFRIRSIDKFGRLSPWTHKILSVT